jgi:hypothetical protein
VFREINQCQILSEKHRTGEAVILLMKNGKWMNGLQRTGFELAKAKQEDK